MVNRRHGFRAAVVVIAGLIVAHRVAVADEPLTRFEFVEPHMGTQFRMLLYATNEATAKRASAAAFQRIGELNGIMSDYDANSELMRLCAKAGSVPVPVSADLFAVLSQGTKIAEITGGAFDMTIGPVVRLWRLSRRTRLLPDAAKLAAARSLVDYRNVRLEAATRAVTLKVAGMQLDLGGIAKGYAASAAQNVLKQNGIARALVAAGGDVVVSGPPPAESGWAIGIGPVRESEAPAPKLTLKESAVSTSGDAFQYVEIGGKRYAHIIDPRTGMGVTDIFQVTVVAADGMTADGWATALAVLGPEQGLAVSERIPNISARFIRRKGEGVEERRSSRFPLTTER